MKFRFEDLKYLHGEIYSSGNRFIFDKALEDNVYVSRNSYLANLVSGKKIIHFGCVDHDIESITKKNESGNWLHQVLTDSSTRCVGIDIKEDECRYIREELGYPDIECVNILESESVLIGSDRWDYILLPDVIEHIPSPGLFLKALHHAVQGVTDKIVITTPNGLADIISERARRGYEIINSDHRMVFTPFTLSKLLTEAGFKVESIHTCRHGSIKRHKWLENWKMKKYPLLRDTLVIHAVV